MVKILRKFTEEPKRITVKVNPDLHQAVKNLADRKEMTMSDMIRGVLEVMTSEEKRSLQIAKELSTNTK